MRVPWGPLLLVLLACGGGSSGDPVAAPTGSIGPTGSTGSTGSSGPTGSTGPTASGVRLERLDASAECDGLVPEHAPAPVELSWAPPAGAACGPDLAGEGTGHVAVSARAGDVVTWQAFAPDGTALGRFTAWPLVPQPNGWQGLSVTPVGSAGGSRVAHRNVHPDGAAAEEAAVCQDPSLTATQRWALAQDPAGGVFTLVGDVDLYHNHFTSLWTQRFDAAGLPRWAGVDRAGGNGEHAIEYLGAGVSRAGESLSLWQRSAFVELVWQDAGGRVVAEDPGTERYVELLGSDAWRPYRLELAPLLDGGLALRVDGQLRRTYARLAIASSPLPAWLAARAAWTLRFTRGNRGYALFPPAGLASPDCALGIELRAPSGLLCGRVTLPGGGACTTGGADQGWDGTVVAQAAAGACRYRAWPRLLAR